MSPPPSGNHNKSVFWHSHTLAASEMIWRGSSNSHATYWEQTCAADWSALPLVLISGSKKEETGFTLTLFRETLKCLRVCAYVWVSVCVCGFHLIWHHTGKPVLYSASLSISHKEVLTHRSVNMLEFEQGVEISNKGWEVWVKWDCHSDVNRDHIMVLRQHSVGRFRFCTHTHTHTHTHRNRHAELNLPVCIMQLQFLSSTQN